MNRVFERSTRVIGTALLVLSFPAVGSINKNITIEDGATADGASSVNGSITVGDNANVTAKITTVNGAIRIGDGATIRNAGTVNGSVRIGSGVQADDVETVNGGIRMRDNVQINGAVSAVNGSVEVGQGSRIARDLSNVNGDIELSGSQVGGDVSTVSGDVEVMDGSIISGDLIIEEPKGMQWGRNSKKPTVVIGPGSRVDGMIRAERDIKLYISTTAEVGGVDGKVTMSDAVRFDGSRP